MKKRPLEEYVDEIVDGASRVYSVASSEKEIFVATGELTGYGYALWRMGTEFDNPERVIKKLSGCCGQIDVQVKGDVLFVADNTQHAVTKYDRKGEKLGSFGKTGRVSNGLEFGSCCNPMNCRIDKQGFVYTAESEGIVKKFSEDGAFLELVGVAKLEGGCKNVAVAVSPDAKRVYFCDQPGSRIVILEQKDAGEKK
jgi:sugar lactone lactonase YvrE